MLALLLTLLAPTPPDRPAEPAAGVWVVDGPHWAGYTLHFGADGSYAAWTDTSLYVGHWSDAGGVLVVRERSARWCDEDGPAFGPWQRYEFEGVAVRGGRLTAGRLTMRRAE